MASPALRSLRTLRAPCTPRLSCTCNNVNAGLTANGEMVAINGGEADGGGR